MVERRTTSKPRTSSIKEPAAEEKAPVGRYYDLQQEVGPAEPYVLTENIVIAPMTRKQFKAVQAAEDDDAANRAALSEQYDAVIAWYDDKPAAEWDAFVRDFYRHIFGRGAAEAPGKSEESSSS